MDFIEKWLHISPDGGNGASELLIIIFVVMTVVGVVSIARRRDFSKNFIEYLEQIWKRAIRGRFDE